jgi:hypothetical protein
MCLSTVRQQFEPPEPTERQGWKIFVENKHARGPLYPCFQRGRIESPVTINEWIEDDKNIDIQSNTGQWWSGSNHVGQIYKTGFHIFACQSNATSLAEYLAAFPNRFMIDFASVLLLVVPVTYKDLVATGIQHWPGIGTTLVDVAKKMRIDYDPTVDYVIKPMEI